MKDSPPDVDQAPEAGRAGEGLRLVIIAGRGVRSGVSTSWAKGVDSDWIEVSRVTEGQRTLQEAEIPDLWVTLNHRPRSRLPPTPLGTLALRTRLARAADRAEPGEPLIVCVADWTRGDEPRALTLDRIVVPTYAADTWRDVTERAEEVSLLALRRAVTRILRGAPDRERADHPRTSTGRYRPLGPMGQLLWRVQAGLRHGTRQLQPRRLFKRLLCLLGLVLVRPIRDRTRSLRGRHPVRIFTFHRITDLCRDSLSVSRRVFRKQLLYIRRYHRIVSLDEALEVLATGRAIDRPLAVITFDDAYTSVREFAFPEMAELGIPGCCFAPTDYVGADRRFPWDLESPVSSLLAVMSWKELRSLHDSGWTIGAHSATHSRLADCDEASLRRELEGPLMTLRDALRTEPVALAYPFGGPDDLKASDLRTVRDLGYSACLSNYGGENFPPASAYRLRRIDIGGDLDGPTWKARVHAVDPGGWRESWLSAKHAVLEFLRPIFTASETTIP